MTTRHVLNAAGDPVPEPDLMAWGRWLGGSAAARRVAQTVVGAATVSTVFLGLDHNFMRSGPPLLYETTAVMGLIRAWSEDWSPDSPVKPVLADAMEDAGYADRDVLDRLRWVKVYNGHRLGIDPEPFRESLLGIPRRLSGYDWANAFAYAGEPVPNADGSASVKPAVPDSGISTAPFARWDVADLYAADEGERDETNWVCYGRLKDGRYFFLTAGCDYTGWG